MRDYCLHQQWSRLRDSVTNISKHSWLSGSVSNSRQEGLWNLNRNPGNLINFEKWGQDVYIHFLRIALWCIFVLIHTSKSKQIDWFYYCVLFYLAPWFEAIVAAWLQYRKSVSPLVQTENITTIRWFGMKSNTTNDKMWHFRSTCLLHRHQTTYTFIYGLSSQWASWPHKAASMTHFLAMLNKILKKETCNENSQYCV